MSRYVTDILSISYRNWIWYRSITRNYASQADIGAERNADVTRGGIDGGRQRPLQGACRQWLWWGGVRLLRPRRVRSTAFHRAADRPASFTREASPADVYCDRDSSATDHVVRRRKTSHRRRRSHVAIRWRQRNGNDVVDGAKCRCGGGRTELQLSSCECSRRSDYQRSTFA